MSGWVGGWVVGGVGGGWVGGCEVGGWVCEWMVVGGW